MRSNVYVNEREMEGEFDRKLLGWHCEEVNICGPEMTASASDSMQFTILSSQHGLANSTLTDSRQVTWKKLESKLGEAWKTWQQWQMVHC